MNLPPSTQFLDKKDNLLLNSLGVSTFYNHSAFRCGVVFFLYKNNTTHKNISYIGVQMGSSVADFIEHKKTGTNLTNHEAVRNSLVKLCDKPQLRPKKGQPIDEKVGTWQLLTPKKVGFGTFC
jgi:hypothetical protein